jgi:predicted metal-dependent HD superfamily phosphohydrolase
MKEFVVKLLNSGLPSYCYYHNYKHTLYVLNKAVEIGRYEKCTDQEIGLLSAGALWHDTGFIHTFTGHEEEGCLLAQQYLPGFGFSGNDIDSVCGMIRATKIPQSPQNKLEEIIADADLEYLGTASAATKAEDLFKELKALDPAFTKEQWNKVQISFLQKHHYFTRFCKQKREPVKLKYMEQLMKSE